MFPHFLCIGAQKAGTSWLHDALRAHPEVWVPPVKEFHYFDLPGPLPTAMLTIHRQRFRTHLRRWNQARAQGRQQEARWLRRYLFHPRSDAWYGSLFARDDGRVCGDITPAYARLGEQTVAHIASLMPNARIIYILRDPVDRAWSQIRMDWGRRGRLDGAAEQRVLDYLRSDHADRNGRYPEIIARWQSHFSREAVHIDFFDAVATEPTALLTRVYAHLGLVQTDGPFPDDPTRVRNASDAADMPPAIARYLGQRYLPVTESIAESLPNRWTHAWAQHARDLAGT